MSAREQLEPDLTFAAPHHPFAGKGLGARGAVEAHDAGPLPGRHRRLPMREASIDLDAYLDGWRWGPVEERPGTPDEVLEAVILASWTRRTRGLA